MTQVVRGFASDNASGAHPLVMAAMSEANAGHVHAYGADPWTERAHELMRREFGSQVETFFVFNGTGANSTALQALIRSYEAVICPASAHINTDECGAPERFTGGKLLAVDTPDGKLTPALIEGSITGVGFEHTSQPAVVSITQSTEYGTVYRPDELRAIAETARSHGLRLHVDGARLSNAAAALGCSLGEACAGADVLSFGATKNGAVLAESVVFFDPALADGFKYVRKQSAQLASKMRYVSAQYVALLEDGLWRRNAENANAMAALLADRVRTVPGVRITQAVDANEVFAILPREVIGPLAEKHDFYVWDERADEVRWVTSWDTTTEDVERFAAAVAEACAGVGA
ncbi:threonine aldolase family protein [Anaerosoma tenue]|uniref:threonine aldolase family protein n=1 Tax=Anaerosoma tenue TaxID=2933588 RepID=UPI002260EE97|nr:low specificity L-threonine aldolase [Anaerosoma tenue]MCK8115887.1 low specificity L-threonine aldolase [Anaerosoma tenue]